MQCLLYAGFGMPIGMLGAGWPEARSAFGGTAPVRVAEQLAALRREIAAGRSWAQER